MVTVCIDGWNLALRHGSGIATYGHSLLSALDCFDARRQVLYGPVAPRAQQPILNEIALIDAGRTRQPASISRAVRTALARFGRSAHAIVPTGEVIWPNHRTRKPAAESYWASEDIFNLANRAYQRYGVFTPVTFRGEQEVPAPDIMHWTCPMPLTGKRAINIVTFHDIIPLLLPHTTSDAKRNYYNLCRRVADRADHILSVSEATKNDLVRILNVNPDKITTTFQAIEPFEDGSDNEECAATLHEQFSLDWKSYFLFYGALEPKKNLGRVVEAYLASGARSKLVVVGGRSWLSEVETGLLEAVLAHGSTDRIIKLEYLPRSALMRLVRGARATLFPSLYEGFGLPALESMAVGTAVLTSREGALVEVAGDAALTVNPYDVNEISRAIRILDSDEDALAALQAMGPVQAGKFSMTAYRQRIAEAYARVGISLSRNRPD